MYMGRSGGGATAASVCTPGMISTARLKSLMVWENIWGCGTQRPVNGKRKQFLGDRLMSKQPNFVSLALAGAVMLDEIDDYVDEWHANPHRQLLHNYLGMNPDEYALWLSSPDSLALIVAARKLSKPLDVIANDNLQLMRLAARAEDSKIVKQLEAWLEQRRG